MVGVPNLRARHDVRWLDPCASTGFPPQAEQQTGFLTRNLKTSRLPPQAEQHAFKKAADQLSGAVPSPLAGPCGGLGGAPPPPRAA